jgi:type I site-specific restriction endonuclease
MSIADYLLEFKGKRLAVIEAKKWDLSHTEGVSQSIRDGKKLGLPFAFSTNGQLIRQINLLSGEEKDISKFPTPEELWSLINEPKNELLEKLRSIEFDRRGGTEPIRYYIQTAVEKVLEGIANGDKRLLLTLATGTGKTRIAFHIAWKLFQARWNLSGDFQRRPRILFLADRNILADQAYNEFSPFPEDALIRIAPDSVRKKGKVPTNGNIFFTIFQTLQQATEITVVNRNLVRSCFRRWRGHQLFEAGKVTTRAKMAIGTAQNQRPQLWMQVYLLQSISHGLNHFHTQGISRLWRIQPNNPMCWKHFYS